MTWMVIYEYGVPGEDLNLNSTNYPEHGHHGDPPLSGKNPHSIAGNQTPDLMISSQKCWPLDHEAGPQNNLLCLFSLYNKYVNIHEEATLTIWHWNLTTVHKQCKAENTKHPLKLSAMYTQSNGQPFKPQVLCRLQTLNPGSKVLTERF
jgi:hypothetical protein